MKERDFICKTRNSHFIPNFTLNLALAFAWRSVFRAMGIYISKKKKKKSLMFSESSSILQQRMPQYYLGQNFLIL